MTIEKPRVLLIYGSLRVGSTSRALIHIAKSILDELGAETKIFEAEGLPVFDFMEDSNRKVQELYELTKWSNAQVWCSPEFHGNMTGMFKNIIDWMPCNGGAAQSTEGKPVAVMSVTGGAQSFNTVNNMRLVAKWIRMPVCTEQLVVPYSHDSIPDLSDTHRDRLVKLMKELVELHNMLQFRNIA